MNAPLPTRLEQIEAYKGLLREDFVQEIVERHKLTQINHKKSIKSVENVKVNCTSISAALGDIERELNVSVSCFAQLSENSSKSAEAFSDLSEQMRIMAKNLQRQAQLIRENLVL